MKVRRKEKKPTTSFDNKSKKQKELLTRCIHKFFYAKLPEMIDNSDKYEFRKEHGGDVESLGIEKALESTIGLFYDGELFIVADNINNFSVFTFDNDKLMILYEEGNANVKKKR